LSDSLLPFLKSRQLPSIKHTQPPHSIFTGAGTGKTTTITAKRAHMVEKEEINLSNHPENLKYLCSYK
jgi:superfamily I DNA/RNA helicase